MILFITRKFPPSVGGMERLSSEMTRAVGAITPSKVIAWRGARALWPLFAIAAFFRAAAVLMSRPVHIIHVSDPVLAPLGLALGRLWGVRWAVTAHGLDVIYPSRLYRAVVLPCLRRADVVVCISRAARAACIARGVRSERCAVIPVGLAEEPPSLDPAASRRELEAHLGRALPGTLILAAGRLVPRKGVEWLVREVLPQIAPEREWTLLVVGEGPARAGIERAVSEAGLGSRVVLAGRLPRERLEQAYAAADLFVMPNVAVPGDMEGFGIVAIEAASRGLPVLAADLEGIPDAIVDGENGRLLPSGSSRAWADAIEAWLGDAEARRALGARARAYTTTHYLWSSLAHRYIEAFALRRGEAEERWDQAYLAVRRGVTRRRRRLETFDLPKDARLLDLGCGDGIDTRILQDLGFTRIVSLDRSLELLRAGRPPRAVAAGAYETPCADGALDAVVVDGVLHHLDVDRALAEIARILRPGGAFCVVEPASSRLRALLDWVTLSPLARFSRELRQRRTSLAEEWETYRAWLAEDKRLPERLAQAGLERVRFRRSPLNIVAQYRRSPEPDRKPGTERHRHD